MFIARDRKQFKINTQVLKLAFVHFRWIVSCPVPPQPSIGTVILETVPIAWDERAGLIVARPIPALGMTIYRLLCGLHAFPETEHQDSTRTRTHTHTYICIYI